MLRPLAFIAISTLAFLAAALSAAGQPVKVLRIGFLGTSPANPHYEALRQGLQELGYVEGQNIVIERRYSEGRAERLPDLAISLVRLRVDLIVVDAGGIEGGKFFELYEKWFGERGVVPYPMSDKVRNSMIMQSVPE
jgi:ABC-type sugar transport system substrate-binding protein